VIRISSHSGSDEGEAIQEEFDASLKPAIEEPAQENNSGGEEVDD